MVNNATLLGRITKDPEVKAVGNGSAVCNFSLAVNRNFKNQKGEYEADFINVVAFGNTAQRMQQYVTKGNLLAVTGRIQTRNYENSAGQKVYVTEVVANNVSFVENKKASGSASAGAEEEGAKEEVASEDVTTTEAPVEEEVIITEVEDDDLPF